MCLVCDFSILALGTPMPAARSAFCLCFVCSVLLLVVVLSCEPKQNQGQRLVDRKLVHAPPPSPSNFTAGRPKAALLFFCFFFGYFRCGVPLIIVILIIYKYKNSYKKMLNVRLGADHLYGK